MAGGADIRAGRAFVELFLKDSFTRDFAKSLNSAQRHFADAGSAIAGAGAKLIAASVAGLTPAVLALKDFVKTGGDLNDMAARTGIAASSLAELGYAVQQTGGDLSDLETGTKKLSKTLADAFGGGKDSTALLNALGLSVEQLQSMNPEQQLIAVGEAIDKIGDPAVRSAAAMELFGKSGTKLLPMLKDLEAARAEARSLGVMNEDDVTKADDLGDSFGRLITGVRGVGTAIASALYPPLKAATTAATEYVKTAIAWVRENQQVIVTAAKIAVAVGAAGAALVGIGSSLMAGAATIKGFLAGFATIKAVVSGVMAVIAAVASPIGLVVTGLVAAGAVFLTLTDTGNGLMGMFQELAASIVGLTSGGDIGAIIQGIGAAAQQAVAGITQFIQANRETIVSVAGMVAAIAGIGAGVMVAVKAFAILTAGWGMVLGAIALAKAAVVGIGAALAFLVTPVGLVVAGIAVATAAIFTFTDAGAALMQSLRDMATAVIDFGRQVGSGIMDAMRAGDFKLAGEIAMQALYVVFQEGLAKIKTLWIDLKYGIFQVWDDVLAKINETWNAITGGVAKGILNLLVKLNVVDKDALKTLEADETRNATDRKTGRDKATAERNSEYEKEIEAATAHSREARKKLDALTDLAAERAAEKKAEQEKLAAEKGANGVEGAKGRHQADIEGDAKYKGGSGGKDGKDPNATTAATVHASSAAIERGATKHAGGVTAFKKEDKNKELVEAIKNADAEQAKRDEKLIDKVDKLQIRTT